MPIKKNIKYKKRSRPRRRKVVKIGRRMKISRPIYYFKRRFDNTGTGSTSVSSLNLMPNQIVVAAGSSVSVGFRFQFDYVRAYTEFTALFDQFRISKIIIRMHCRQDPSAQSSSSAVYPELLWVRDRDDGNTPTTNSLLERADSKKALLAPNRYKKIAITPTTLTATYGPVTNSYYPVYKRFIDAGAPSTPYYGFKCNINNLASATSYTIDMDYMFYFACRDVR